MGHGSQLVEQSLPTPEFILNIVYCQLCRKDKNKEKEAGIGHLFIKKNSMGPKFSQALVYRGDNLV